MKKVLITGTFDRLHPGHIHYLKQAKKLGDYLIVIIARDKTVKKVKESWPINNEQKRARLIRQTKIPNRVILGKIRDKYAIIEKNKPDIIALGYDQNIFTKKLNKELIKRGLKTKIKRLKAYNCRAYSGTECAAANPAAFSSP